MCFTLSVLQRAALSGKRRVVCNLIILTRDCDASCEAVDARSLVRRQRSSDSKWRAMSRLERALPPPPLSDADASQMMSNQDQEVSSESVRVRGCRLGSPPLIAAVVPVAARSRAPYVAVALEMYAAWF
jgi:hypothetical protein